MMVTKQDRAALARVAGASLRATNYVGDSELEDLARMGQALVEIADALKSVPANRRAPIVVAASVLGLAGREEEESEAVALEEALPGEEPAP